MTRYLSGLPHKRSNYIYIVKCLDYYKVGRTSRMGARMTDFRVNNPLKVELYYYADCGIKSNYILEKELHAQVEEHKHRGEWYVLPKDKITRLVNIIEDYVAT